MDVVSCCPLKVATLVWQPERDAWTQTVICKATFRLEPGTSVLAERQDDPVARDVAWTDDPKSSLRAPSDLAPLKSTVDVVVVGSAFAPLGRPVHSVKARLAIDNVDKSIEVWCDRVLHSDGRVLVGSAFTHLPLRYERAWLDPIWNPVGVGPDAAPDIYGAILLPNLQAIGQRFERRNDPVASLCFGPVSASWVARARLAPAGWSPLSLRDTPLPGGFDGGYFSIAPLDQRLYGLGAREQIVLEHLHPKYEKLETKLPGLRPNAKLAGGGDEIALHADTLLIDSDRGLAIVTYRGSIALSNPREAGRIEIRIEEASEDEEREDERVEDEEGATVRMRAGEAPTQTGIHDPGASLPFQQPKSPWIGFKKPEATPPRREDTGTIMGGQLSARDVVPYGWNVKRNEQGVLSVVKAEDLAPDADDPETPEADDTPTPPLDQTNGKKKSAETPSIEDAEAKPEVAKPDVAKIEGVAIGAAVPIDDKTSDERTEDAPRGPLAAPPPPPPPAVALPENEASASGELPLETFPIARCAAISASIARTPDSEAEVLKSHELDAATWNKLERHYADALREEAARAKAKLLQQYDDAYVAQIEKERGPIEVGEYARLTAAAERGNAAEILAELGIPTKAKMRIERVWLRKIVSDPKLGKSVAKAVNLAKNS